MIALDAGRLKRIHVNKHIISANRKNGRNDPALRCKIGRDNHKAYSIKVRGPCEIIHSPDKPLKCGAVVWIETKAPVTLS